MRNTRKRRHLPLETFESRQLLSASVAQAATPLVANSSPALVVSNQSDTGTTIQAATNQSFGGYLGTFSNLSIPNAPTGAFSLPYVSGADYSATINWGDGTFSNGDNFLVHNANGGYDLYASHVFHAAGSYQISVSLQTQYVNPASGLVTSSIGFTGNAQVSDNNPNAPQLPQLSAPNGTFSGTLASFFGDNTTEILWGNGGAWGGPNGPLSSSIDPSKIGVSATYSTTGVTTVAVLQGGTNSVYFEQMNVTGSISPPPPMAPTITPLRDVVAGQPFAGYLGIIKNLQLPGQPDLINGGTSVDSAIVNNTSQSATLNLSVDWGDGTTNNAVYLVSNGDGTYGVYGYHTYASAGSFFPISVTLATSHTPSPSNDGTFLPGPDPFQYGLSAFTAVAATGTSSLPQLSAPNGLFNGKITSSTGDGTASIDWGDGSTSTPTLVSTGGDILVSGGFDTLVASDTHPFDASGSHTYAADGTYLLTFFSRESHTIYFAEVTSTGTGTPAPAGNPIIPTQPTTPASPSQSQAPKATAVTPQTSTPTPQTVTPKSTKPAPKTTTPAPKAPALKQVQLTAGKKFSGILATTPFDGTNNLNPKITINWGDGTISTGIATREKNVWNLVGTHTYAKPGNHTIKISWAQSPMNSTVTYTYIYGVGNEVNYSYVVNTGSTSTPPILPIIPQTPVEIHSLQLAAVVAAPAPAPTPPFTYNFRSR